MSIFFNNKQAYVIKKLSNLLKYSIQHNSSMRCYDSFNNSKIFVNVFIQHYALPKVSFRY